jgi:hypothetical protein
MRCLFDARQQKHSQEERNDEAYVRLHEEWRAHLQLVVGKGSVLGDGQSV